MESPHSESNILHPAIKASSISSKSFEMLLLQTVNKNAAAKKKKQITTASSKAITSECWIEAVKKNKKNLNLLISTLKEKSQTTTVNQKKKTPQK